MAFVKIYVLFITYLATLAVRRSIQRQVMSLVNIKFKMLWKKLWPKFEVLPPHLRGGTWEMWQDSRPGRNSNGSLPEYNNRYRFNQLGVSYLSPESCYIHLTNSWHFFKHKLCTHPVPISLFIKQHILCKKNMSSSEAALWHAEGDYPPELLVQLHQALSCWYVNSSLLTPQSSPIIHLYRTQSRLAEMVP